MHSGHSKLVAGLPMLRRPHAAEASLTTSNWRVLRKVRGWTSSTFGSCWYVLTRSLISELGSGGGWRTLLVVVLCVGLGVCSAIGRSGLYSVAAGRGVGCAGRVTNCVPSPAPPPSVMVRRAGSPGRLEGRSPYSDTSVLYRRAVCVCVFGAGPVSGTLAEWHTFPSIGEPRQARTKLG